MDAQPRKQPPVHKHIPFNLAVPSELVRLDTIPQLLDNPIPLVLGLDQVASCSGLQEVEPSSRRLP